MSRSVAPLGTNIVNPYLDELIETAKKIATAGKGILASDETTANLGKKFETIGLENNIVNRRRYRELLYMTPNLNRYISAIIFGADGKTIYNNGFRNEAVGIYTLS